MLPKTATTRPPQQKAPRADARTIDARYPFAHVASVREDARWTARFNRRLKAAARQAFRLMGED
jgi:hypothetical protein